MVRKNRPKKNWLYVVEQPSTKTISTPPSKGSWSLRETFDWTVSEQRSETGGKANAKHACSITNRTTAEQHREQIRASYLRRLTQNPPPAKAV